MTKETDWGSLLYFFFPRNYCFCAMLWRERSIFHWNCDLFDVLCMVPRQNNHGHIKKRKPMGLPFIWPRSWDMGNAVPNPLKWLREIMPRVIYLHRHLLLSRYLTGSLEILLDVLSYTYIYKLLDLSNRDKWPDSPQFHPPGKQKIMSTLVLKMVDSALSMLSLAQRAQTPLVTKMTIKGTQLKRKEGESMTVFYIMT